MIEFKVTIFERHGKLYTSYDYISHIYDKILYSINVLIREQDNSLCIYKDDKLFIQRIIYNIRQHTFLYTYRDFYSIEIKNINANNALDMIKTVVINDEFHTCKLEEVVMILDEFVKYKQRLLNEVDIFFDNLGNREFFVSPKYI